MLPRENLKFRSSKTAGNAPKTCTLLILSLSMDIHPYSAVPDPDLEIRGGGGAKAGLPKKFFGSFGPQFGPKIRGGWAPLLDLPLFWCNKSYCTWCMWLNLHARELVEFYHTLQTGLSHKASPWMET